MLAATATALPPELPPADRAEGPTGPGCETAPKIE